MKGHSKHSGGFTLIETTIAMVVMMVVGLGATSLFLYAIRNNAGGESRSQALAIAQQRLEELREVSYDDPQLALGETTSTVVLQDVEAGGTPSGQSANAGGQTYGAMSTTGSITPLAPGKGKGGTPTPTPTPTTGGGGTGGGTGGGSDDIYKVLVDVDGLPAGSATPTRKRITITVTPENGYGSASWINQNPVTIIIHRSSPTTGPYRQ